MLGSAILTWALELSILSSFKYNSTLLDLIDCALLDWSFKTTADKLNIMLSEYL